LEPNAGSVILSRDAKLAGINHMRNLDQETAIADLASGQIVRRLPLDVSNLQGIRSFSPDGKAIVQNVTSKGGNALLYRPIDGSPAHLLIGPLPDAVTFFAWSPSGSKLGVLQLRRSSDVVLITDITGKQPR